MIRQWWNSLLLQIQHRCVVCEKKICKRDDYYRSVRGDFVHELCFKKI
jgi:hypothetical protein